MTRRDGFWMAALAAGAFLLAYFLAPPFVYPGESARLLVAWANPPPSGSVPHPLLAVLYAGLDKALMPLLASFIVVVAYHFALCAFARPLAARVAAAVLLLSPAVLRAATHLEPRLFDFAMAVGVLLLLKAFCTRWRHPLWVRLLALVGATGLAPGEFISLLAGRTLAELYHSLQAQYFARGWLFVFLFSVLPLFLVLLVRMRERQIEAEGGEEDLVELVPPSKWIFHLALSFFAILSIATPLSPYQLMEGCEVFPVASSFTAALTAGYLVAFWFERRESVKSVLPRVAGGILVFVFAFALLFSLGSFDRSRGAFADAVAEVVLDELGERTALVTDGLVDNHLRLRAAARGKVVRLYSFADEGREGALAELQRQIRAERLGGERSEELALTARLGLGPFLQDYVRFDSAVTNVLAFFTTPAFLAERDGAPVAGGALYTLREFPEGATPAWERVKGYLLSNDRQREVASLVSAPRVLEVTKLLLRRHFARVLNDRGAALQAAGDLTGASLAYQQVLDEIDPESIPALLNLCRLAAEKEPKAAARRTELERMVALLVQNEPRRRVVDRLLRPPEPQGVDPRLTNVVEAVQTGELAAARNLLLEMTAVPTEDPLVWTMALGMDIAFGDAATAEVHAKRALKADRELPLANYVLGSLALSRGEYGDAEVYLRKAADAARPVALAMNDLAEVLRRQHRLDEALVYARRATEADPSLYVAWETMGTVLVEQRGDLAQAKAAVEKAVELSAKDGRAADIRMLVSLARVQIAIGDTRPARTTLRKIRNRLGELSDFERGEYEELMKRVE